jgi:hypothetical protein
VFQASLWGFDKVVGDLIAAGANLHLADQVYPIASRSCSRLGHGNVQRSMRYLFYLRAYDATLMFDTTQAPAFHLRLIHLHGRDAASDLPTNDLAAHPPCSPRSSCSPQGVTLSLALAGRTVPNPRRIEMRSPGGGQEANRGQG